METSHKSNGISVLKSGVSASKRAGLLALALVFAAGLTSCGTPGANTNCKDFNAMKSGDQTNVIKKIYADKGETNPSALKVTAYKLSAKAYCQVKPSDAKLSGMSG
ncbi:hypothetical protein [Paenarthrobacter aurescens]|uniref:Uncharacterized protein n=1 Tax=Paenarthrobacter aurescens TaxID=43663 RepID=A0A4Y3N7R2_PAEAU|nr:hypothetical protein [Paenarthrobacter aurescens]MDO6144531.1 hypothetical protein [Paenarthrobacter aurescens]MDO6148376.1 hypothetical protein [Paenarthrobacter aurescens]MDO6159622.1 hypothetical protein [Paenarthrobacter aurescens]MDO6164524.1 hypothetical protein [Paenarthrobacter aurescens]GEB17810.1 hypothetical protein AAU01_05650 [Paenarthrobacter aurescens]